MKKKALFAVLVALGSCFVYMTAAYGDGSYETWTYLERLDAQDKGSAARGAGTTREDATREAVTEQPAPQQAQARQQTQPLPKTQALEQADVRQLGAISRADKLIGLEVKGQQGERVGSIADILIDVRTGRVAYAVMEGDAGVVGANDRLFAIPWNAFTPSAAGDALTLTIDRDRLARAPSFTKDNWPLFTPGGQVMEVDLHKFYGVQPYWEGGGSR